MEAPLVHQGGDMSQQRAIVRPERQGNVHVTRIRLFLAVDEQPCGARGVRRLKGVARIHPQPAQGLVGGSDAEGVYAVNLRFLAQVGHFIVGQGRPAEIAHQRTMLFQQVGGPVLDTVRGHHVHDALDTLASVVRAQHDEHGKRQRGGGQHHVPEAVAMVRMHRHSEAPVSRVTSSFLGMTQCSVPPNAHAIMMPRPGA